MSIFEPQKRNHRHITDNRNFRLFDFARSGETLTNMIFYDFSFISDKENVELTNFGEIVYFLDLGDGSDVDSFHCLFLVFVIGHCFVMQYFVSFIVMRKRELVALQGFFFCNFWKGP